VIVYEVRIVIDPAIESEYRAWLDAHIAEIVALPGFTGAELFREDHEAAPCFVMHYHLTDRAALESYYANHAPRLRADGLARFGGKFTASRRVMVRESAFC